MYLVLSSEVLRGYKYQVGIKKEMSVFCIKSLILFESRKNARCDLAESSAGHFKNM
jgi:hypothetical protein